MDSVVYTELPDGWEVPSDLPKDDYVLRLHKALYGHRKAPSLWNEEIDSSLRALGLVSSSADACLYSKTNATSKVFLLLHVDDFIIADNDRKERNQIMKVLCGKYGIKHLGEVQRYTNYQIERNRAKREIYIHQHDFFS